MKSERATKIFLISAFISALFVVGLTHDTGYLSTLDWIMLGLAALRCGRMIAFELIFEPFRSSFAVTVEHPHAGMTTEPRYDSGWRKSIGELITCPICAGTWSAAVLLYGLILLPGPFHLLITLLSAVSIAELGHETIERLCWGSAQARKHSK